MIEAVKAHSPIRSVIGAVIHLEKDSGLCPFHPDKHPSLTIKGERWKCWSCGEGGDVLDFVAKYHGLDTRGAIKLLADRAGLSRQAPDKAAAETARRERDRKAELVRAFRQWEQAAADRLAALLRAFRGMQARARSEGDLETSAVLQGEIDTLEYRYEIFCRRDDREKFQIYEEAVGYAGAEI